MTSPPALVAAALALLVATLSWSAPATAAEPSSEELYIRGKAALEAGRFDDAREAFEAALGGVEDEVMRWQLLLGVAVARELAGDPVGALEHYRRFIVRATGSPLARTPKWTERLDVARRSVASAEAEVLQTRGMLIVEGGSPFADTVLTGAAGAEPLTLPARRYLTPGVYRVQATATGMTPFSALVELHVGDRRRIEVQLAPVEAEAGPTELRRGEPPADSGAEAAWVPIGVGAALLLSGGILTGLAYGDARDVERLSHQPGTPDVLAEHARLTARGEDRQTASWICYGAGVAAVGAGVLWMLLDDAPATGASVTPVGLRLHAGPSGAAAALGGHF